MVSGKAQEELWMKALVLPLMAKDFEAKQWNKEYFYKQNNRLFVKWFNNLGYANLRNNTRDMLSTIQYL